MLVDTTGNPDLNLVRDPEFFSRRGFCLVFLVIIRVEALAYCQKHSHLVKSSLKNPSLLELSQVHGATKNRSAASSQDQKLVKLVHHMLYQPWQVPLIQISWNDFALMTAGVWQLKVLLVITQVVMSLKFFKSIFT